MSRNRLDTIPSQIDIPVDVICTIFETLRDANRTGDPNSTYESSLRWIPEATHVCRSWRAAALSVRYLWTNISVAASIPWALEFARRSGNAPISITITRPTDEAHPKLYECTKMLLHDNRQRIRKIVFDFFNNREAKFIMSALSDGTHKRRAGPSFYDILEDLRISFTSESSFSLTTKVLHAPELKRLSLRSCFVGAQFGFLRNLSRLYISNNNISASHLHNVLLQTRNLEVLVLEEFFTPDPSSVDSDGFQPVILPKLIRVEASGNIAWVSAILQMISYGPQRNLLVDSNASSFHQLDQILPLFTCIMSHAGESSSIRQLGLSITSSSQSARFLLNAWRGEGEWTSEPDIALFVKSLPFESQLGAPMSHLQAFGPTKRLLVGLLRKLNYQDLQILQLDSAEPLTSQLWVKLFGALPSLTSIEICRGERELFGALVDQPGHMPERTNMLYNTLAGLPFRALQAIKFGERSGLYSEEDVEFMLTCLRTRLDRRMGLKSLVFRLPCGNKDLISQVAAFEEVVELVEIKIYEPEPDEDLFLDSE